MDQSRRNNDDELRRARLLRLLNEVMQRQEHKTDALAQKQARLLAMLKARRRAS